MKKIFFLFIIFLFINSLLIGQVSISADGSTPAGSAMLDVKSTSKGVLIPRMTFEQQHAIMDPIEGLMLFCTNCNPDGTGALSIYQGGQWRILNIICYEPNTPLPASSIPSLTQIIWNWRTIPIALGYKWNTLNDYGSALEMGTDTTITDTGLANNTLYNRYVWAYNGCGHSSSLTLAQSTLSNWVCGDTLIINHAAGNISPVTKTVHYGTVTNIPGETTHCWITGNLGADHQADAVNDATEASAGWYWQFNHMQGYKHDGTARTPNTTWIINIDENSNWIPANDPCTLELGSGWRIPTSTEWTNVDASGGWGNWNGPWNSALKMHAAGYLYNTNGSLLLRGNAGAYWSCTQGLNNSGQSLYFFSSSCTLSLYYKSMGFSIRCLHG